MHRCVTVFYQQIENSNIANQIQGFTIDYGKFILIYNNQINVHALIGQSAVGCYAGKPTENRASSEFI